MSNHPIIPTHLTVLKFGRYPVVLGILGSKISLPTKINKGESGAGGGKDSAPSSGPASFVPEDD